MKPTKVDINTTQYIIMNTTSLVSVNLHHNGIDTLSNIPQKCYSTIADPVLLSIV